MIPFVDLKAQYRSLKPEIDRAIQQVLDESQYILGPAVSAFERDFAAFCQTTEAIGVNSGTSALHLALLAVGVRPGDEVITVPFTFVATVSAIEYRVPGRCSWTSSLTTGRWIRRSSRQRSRRAPRRSCRSISMASPLTWIRSSPSQRNMASR